MKKFYHVSKIYCFFSFFIIRWLLDQGCDPSVADKQNQVPYKLTSEKQIKNVFRKFMASFPEKYDYNKVCI